MQCLLLPQQWSYLNESQAGTNLCAKPHFILMQKATVKGEQGLNERDNFPSNLVMCVCRYRFRYKKHIHTHIYIWHVCIPCPLLYELPICSASDISDTSPFIAFFSLWCAKPLKYNGRMMSACLVSNSGKFCFLSLASHFFLRQFHRFDRIMMSLHGSLPYTASH